VNIITSPKIVWTLQRRLVRDPVIASPALSGAAISPLEQRDCFTAFAMTSLISQ
jgi:hypothetical protein